jgi:hypothetical protein
MNEMFHWIILLGMLRVATVASVCGATHGRLGLRFSLGTSIKGAIMMHRSLRVL